MTPSRYQSAIYDWVQTGAGSAVVLAVAGSGKTTTLIDVIHQIPRGQSVRLFAFNRMIAETLKARVRLPNVDASTFHSAGYRALGKELGARVETDRNKTKDLIRETFEETDRRAYGDEMARLIGLMKNAGTGVLRPLTPDETAALVEHHDLDFDYLIPPGTKSDAQFEEALRTEERRVCNLALDLFAISNRAAQEQFAWRIDFDDQLYLPILWDLPLPRYDWVLVDEAQDTNAIQREFLRRSLNPGGRLLAVGDRHQAIYGWRGASHDAIDLIQQQFHAQELPLSVCYRCARSVVEQAQILVPQIEPAPGAPAGQVVQEAARTQLWTLGPADAVLCRNNAPLIKHAYEFIGKGIPVRVLGRDIGDGLKRLIYKLRAESVEELEHRLQDYETREVRRYRKLQQEGKAQGVLDRTACIRTVIDNLDQTEDARTVDAVLQAIDALFGDRDAARLTLSTIHKAKGQEWGTVALICGYLLPSKYATQPWELQQERNLQYVAWTRAKTTLLLIDDKPEWMRKKERQREDEGREGQDMERVF